MFMLSKATVISSHMARYITNYSLNHSETNHRLGTDICICIELTEERLETGKLMGAAATGTGAGKGRDVYGRIEGKLLPTAGTDVVSFTPSQHTQTKNTVKVSTYYNHAHWGRNIHTPT